MKKLIPAILAVLFSLPLAAGTITLNPSQTNVNVGDAFSVNVVYSGNVDEIVGFGFNTAFSANLQLDNFTVAAPFDKISDLGENVVVGVAFEGPTSDSVPLAVLNFTALAVGSGTISVSGAYDEEFLGLYFLFNEDGESIEGSTTLQVNEGSEIPEPSTAWLVAFAAPALAWRLRR